MSTDVTTGPKKGPTLGDAIARLEALLERVRLRAAEPRAAAIAVHQASQPVAAEAASPAAAGRGQTEDERTDGVDGSIEVDVEVVGVRESEARPGVADDAPASDPFDSRERLVAAQPVAPEPALPDATSAAGPGRGAYQDMPDTPAEPAEVDEASASPAIDSGRPIDVAEIEVVAEELEEDEPPVSSRRPVVAQAEERLARLAFGSEEPPPLHTPPPESGRLPSAPSEFDHDVTGVRNAAPLAPRRPVDSPAPPPPELVAEPIRAELAASAAVAVILREAQTFTPPTFVALLDASLAL